MTTLFLDLETYSDVPIQHGTHAYAASAEIMLFAWAVDDGPVSVWDRSVQTCPWELIHAIEKCDTFTAHNSQFDRTVIKHAWPKIFMPGSPGIIWHAKLSDPKRWRDTMVKAMAHSLPGSLGDLCDVLNIPTDKAKDKDGKRLIQLFCKPRPANNKLRRATRETHPADWERFVEYAALDIKAMRAIDKKLPEWNYQGEELALWHLDQVINDRGVEIDMALVKGALAAVAKAKKGLAHRTKAITGGAVQAATQRDAMLGYIKDEHGIELPDLQGATVKQILSSGYHGAAADLPQEVVDLLAIRLQASTSSTAKYAALEKGVSKDNRLRGTLQFNGASRTGRWAGRLFQPQNMPRPSLEQEAIDLGIEALKSDCADLLFDNVMELTSSAIRGCIVAPEGKKLVVADLSNIEGRVLAWLAGEDWKIQAFRDFDAGTGHDLYKLAYAKSFGIRPEDVSKDQRQVGKVQELALGYEGGVGAFLTFAAAYAIDLEAMADQAIAAIPQDVLNEAKSALAWAKLNKRDTFGLSDRAWIVCDSFKRSWRQAHPAISSYWKSLEDAAVAAVMNPGKAYSCRNLRIGRTGNWLGIRLPSGRTLCYPSPQLDDAGKLSYMGINQFSRKWSRLKTYGGKLAENITQGVSRDILASSMPLIESAGYQIVLTCHDEILAETPNTEGYSVEMLVSLMRQQPAWAQGLPLNADGFEAYRYKK